MQQQLSSSTTPIFRSRSFSVGTKLLLVIGVLLFFVILFLNLSTILIVSDDKKAYIYEAQGSQTVLVGTEFVNNAVRSGDSLRLALVTVDPLKPVDAARDAALRGLLENQSDLYGIVLGKLDVSSGLFTQVGTYVQRKNESKFPAQLLTISGDQGSSWLPRLRKRGIRFFNAARVGLDPYLGIVTTDINLLQANSPVIPIAIGFVPLSRFVHAVQGSFLTVVSATGEILYDSDPGRLVSAAIIADDPMFQTASQSSVNQGALEFDEADKRYLGSFVKPGFDLVVMMRTDWNRAQRAIFGLIEKFLLLGLIAIGLGVILAIFFAKSLTQPIKKLFQATKQVAQGDFNVDLAVNSKDEIGALTESFNTMSKQIVELVEEKIEKVKLENELDIASTVQQTLIPPPEFKNETITISSHYESASQCGGDWWGFFTENNRMVLMIADATGHGFPSALITASARSCFSFMNKLAAEDPDFTFSPGAMLAYANRVIFEASLGNIMMTFFIAVFDPETKTLTYSSAGHNPPWLFQKLGDSYKLKSLTCIGNRLGEARDVPDFEEKSVEVNPGDILFMYTDGILEGKSLAGEMFGKKRVKKLVETKLNDTLGNNITSLMSDFRKHNEGKAFDDDVTLVFSKFFPEAT